MPDQDGKSFVCTEPWLGYSKGQIVETIIMILLSSLHIQNDKKILF